MRSIVLTVFIFLLSLNSYAQTEKVLDYKVKNTVNEADRTQMLNSLRADLHKEWKLEFVFSVNYFKVNNNYAWFMGEASRKDGKKLIFPDDTYDCCHVECLYKKENGKWVILKHGAFSTDMWYDGLDKQYPEAAGIIFPKELYNK